MMTHAEGLKDSLRRLNEQPCEVRRWDGEVLLKDTRKKCLEYMRTLPLKWIVDGVVDLWAINERTGRAYPCSYVL